MTRLTTERLVLRPYEEHDRETFFRLNGDPEIMRFFVMRRSREEADMLFEAWKSEAEAREVIFQAVEARGTGAMIGICGLHHTLNVPFYPDGVIEIGWHFVPGRWGKVMRRRRVGLARMRLRDAR